VSKVVEVTLSEQDIDNLIAAMNQSAKSAQDTLGTAAVFLGITQKLVAHRQQKPEVESDGIDDSQD